ncbi:MAG TPA: flagellar hook-length control protein FliK, partial [Myxococcaceae bacterium]|nr:flagellar hook-length control protein FliK [Myxococcaceae bacterium]
MPGQPEPLFYAARAAECLGHLQESVAGYQQTIELAGPAPRTDEIRVVAHQAHHAMARLSRTRLGDPARAHEHLQSALALDPRDMVAIEELLPYFRASGRSAELADALEKAAAVTEAPERRAAFWAEAGELFRGRLSKPEKAERLLASALEADGRNRVALEGMLALAESRRDGGQLCRCLKSLAELAEDPRERARYFRRLAVAARDLAFDLDLAAYALTEVIKLEPDDLPTLGELSGLQRRRADMNGLAQALEMRARSAEAQNDKRLASAALRELAQVLEARLGRVGEALIALEKAARIAPEPSVLLELADLSLRCERPMHARRALEDLLQTQPVNAAPERLAEIRARLGRACEMLGDMDAAKKYYAESFPLRRLDEQLGQHLEALYQQAGQNRELADLWSARAQALLAAERAPEAGPLFLKAGKAFLALGDKQAAVLRLTAALDASAEDAQSADALDALAQLEMERGAKVEAAKLFSRKAALTSDPRAAARLYFRAASLAIGTPREPELLAQALSKDEGLAPARLRRAELLVETEPARALADMEAVLELPESDPEAPPEAERLEWSRRAGMVALKAGRVDTARRHLAFYVAHKSDDVEVHRELVTLHRRAGAKEPLADLLTELAPRLSGDEQRSALRELAELSLALERREAAVDALRDLVSADPTDRNAARTLLDLLPEERDADE